MIEALDGSRPMAWGTLALVELYKDLHNIVYRLGQSFGFVTLLQVWAWEHITVMQPVGRQDRDVASPMVFNWHGGLRYKLTDDLTTRGSHLIG